MTLFIDSAGEHVFQNCKHFKFYEFCVLELSKTPVIEIFLLKKNIA